MGVSIEYEYSRNFSEDTKLSIKICFSYCEINRCTPSLVWGTWILPSSERAMDFSSIKELIISSYNEILFKILQVINIIL